MNENLQKAIDLHKQGRIEMAEGFYLKALNGDFDNSDALYLLATVYLQLHKHGLAAQLLRQAITFNKDHFEAWNNLGMCYKAINKDEDARACWGKALAIEGKDNRLYSDIFCNLCTLYINAGEPEKGIEYALEALKLESQHPDVNWNLGLCYLESGNYGEGFDKYSWGFQTGIRPDRLTNMNIPYWDGSPGKHVAVWGEQGLGDEILFASMIPDLQKISAGVVFECHPRLVKVMQQSFPGVAVYGTRKDAIIEWPHRHPEVNARCAMGDLGKFFRRKIEDFPMDRMSYLQATPDRIEHYKNKLAKLGNRPKVGISWAGGYVKTRKDYRSIPLVKWEPILRQPDVDFISLQYTPDAYAEVSNVEDMFDIRIHHWPSAVTEGTRIDYNETAALVQNLDLAISVNTAVHHLSNAIGTKTWTLTPLAKAWRYYTPPGSDVFPWYPGSRCIQQKELKEWDETMINVSNDLKAFIEANHAH